MQIFDSQNQLEKVVVVYLYHIWSTSQQRQDTDLSVFAESAFILLVNPSIESCVKHFVKNDDVVFQAGMWFYELLMIVYILRYSPNQWCLSIR
jgi:hypothetical protein